MKNLIRYCKEKEIINYILIIIASIILLYSSCKQKFKYF